MVLGWVLVGIVQLAGGLGLGAGGNCPVGRWSWAGCWWELFSWPMVLGRVLVGIVQLAKEQRVEDCGWKRGPRREARGILYTHRLQKDLIIHNKCIKSSFIFWVTQIPSKINGQ